ncbi:MAG: sulfatase-like hydrolase/transferase [Deltaproteobacteria bacterium]
MKYLTKVSMVGIAVLAAVVLVASGTAIAQNIRGAATGPTKAKGYSHPEQSLTMKDVKPADNMYPVLQRPEQLKQAEAKLAALEKKTGKKPNIFIFLMDDTGYMDPGFNGGGVAVGNATPNFDKFAYEGLVLTSAYTTPSCSPTRSTIHTGQNPLHHGILRPPMYGESGGLDGAITLPMLSDMYTEWRDIYFNPEVALSPERFKMMEEDKFNHTEVHCTAANKKDCESGRLIDLDYIKDLDQHWLQVSLDFLDKVKGSKQPWYLYHATRGCHFDNYPNDEYAGKSMARTVYSDCFVEMDDIFGKLMAKLEANGELENTIVLMLGGDNGPECEVPPHARTPFRGCKGSHWEGGVRGSVFAYWKGMIEPGRADGLFDFADILPTVMHLAGVPGAQLAKEFPKDRYVDGVDQASFLIADDHLSNRRSRPYTLNQYFAGMRVDEFKYIWTGEIEDGVVQRGDWGGFSGSIFTESGGAIVFNLYRDPQEDVSIGVRHLPMAIPVIGTAGWYMKELMRYPPQFKIGFLSNNPPMYNLAPKAREMMQKTMEGRGLGRANP